MKAPRLVVAAVAAFLVAVPAASASVPSPIAAVRATHIVHVARVARRSGSVRSCSAQRAHASATERRVLPVACEQPPWVNVLGNHRRQYALAFLSWLEG
jgi:hypothetical protein